MARLRNLPVTANMQHLYEAWPESCAPLGAVTEAIMRGNSPLSPADREMIGAYVSGLNACRYCYGIHESVAAEFGIEPDLLKALIENLETAPIEDHFKPLLRYARQLTEEPAKITDEMSDAVYEAGWNDDALYAVITVTALFNFYNRLVEGAGLIADEHHRATIGTLLKTQGYDLFGYMRGR